MEEMKQNPQQEQSIEQKPAEQDHETKELEDKVIHMLEASQTQVLDRTKGRNQTETEVGNLQAVQEGRVRSETQTDDSSKKLKQSCKQIPKTKATVPRPFSLSTNKRMDVDRRRSADVLKPPKPTLTKSASLNYKRNMARPSLVAEKTLDQRPAATSTRPTSKSSLRLQNSTTKNNKVEVEKKNPQVAFKKQQEGNGVGSNKLGKSSTFKALPLPSFYHQKEVLVTHSSSSKPPMFGQINKTIVPKYSSKTEEKQPPKKVVRTSSFCGKETISKLPRPTRSSLKTTVVSSA